MQVLHLSQSGTQCKTFSPLRWKSILQGAPQVHNTRHQKKVGYTHSAKTTFLLETSCQFRTGTGILVSMKLSWRWRATNGLLSTRRMGLFWTVSTRSSWGRKQKDKNNRHVATNCKTYKQLQSNTCNYSSGSSIKDNLQVEEQKLIQMVFQIMPKFSVLLVKTVIMSEESIGMAFLQQKKRKSSYIAVQNDH